METILEMSPDLRIKFLDRLNNKITTLSYGKSKGTSFSQIKEDVKQLNATVEEIDYNDD